MKKLFISNLDFGVSADQLKDLFNEVGGCDSATIAFDRITGNSKGFGFIEIQDDEQALKAIEVLNGRAMNGRPIKVVEDRGRSGSTGDKDGEKKFEILPSVQRAQLFIKKRRKLDPFQADPTKSIDYKEVVTLSKFLSERGKIMPRRMTGLSAYNQRRLTKAIKKAQSIGIMPYAMVDKAMV